jgi:RHS repeat-associated protein
MTWDARSNLKERTLGTTTTKYAYDAEDRVTSVVASSAAGATPVYLGFAYDCDGGVDSMIGRIRKARSGSSPADIRRITTFGWDEAGRLVRESVQVTGIASPYVTSYQYNAMGEAVHVTYPSYSETTYVRDALGQATAVRSAAGGGGERLLVSGVSHEPRGPIRAMTFGNNTSMSRSSNLRYEPSTIASGPLLLQYTMGWSGHVEGVTANAVDTRAFGYDIADRLTSVSPGPSVGAPNLAFQYDGAAVVQANTPSGSAWSTVYNFGYDQQRNLAGADQFDTTNGNLLGSLCFVHDALGRLTAVGPSVARLSSPGSTSCQTESDLASVAVRFEYDAMNRRVARLDAAGGKEYVHDLSGGLLAEMHWPTSSDGTWTTFREYVWLDGQPLAQREYPEGQTPAEGYIYFFHLDHLGQPRALTNAAGATVWSAVPARPYGDIEESSSVDPLSGALVVTNLRLPGQYDERLFATLGISGLQGPYYSWHRWYLPTLGRYMELDPVALRGGFNGFFGPNWYGYAEGNPTRYTDASGLWVRGVGVGGGFILLTAGVEFYAFHVWDQTGRCGTMLAPAIRLGAGAGVDISMAAFENVEAQSIYDLQGLSVGLNAAFPLVTVSGQASLAINAKKTCESSTVDEKTVLLGGGGSAGLGFSIAAYVSFGSSTVWGTPCLSSLF